MSQIDELRRVAENLVAAERAYIAARECQDQHFNAPEFTDTDDVQAWCEQGRVVGDQVMAALCARQRAEEAARLALWKLVGQTPPERE